MNKSKRMFIGCDMGDILGTKNSGNIILSRMVFYSLYEFFRLFCDRMELFFIFTKPKGWFLGGNQC